MVGTYAAIGALLSVPLGPEWALPLAGLGAAAGVYRSFRKVPAAPVCRIWRVFGGCGGSTTVVDKAGNSGPPRYCWGHPDGKPKRLVNLVVVPAQAAIVVGLVVLLAAVAKGGLPPIP